VIGLWTNSSEPQRHATTEHDLFRPLEQTSSQGIQTLLEAEKEAAKVVQKARQCTSNDCTMSQRFPVRVIADELDAENTSTCCNISCLCLSVFIYINVDRVQKLKDARAEAAKEIEAYRAQKEKDFTSFESEVCDVLACPRSLATTTLS